MPGVLRPGAKAPIMIGLWRTRAFLYGGAAGGWPLLAAALESAVARLIFNALEAPSAVQWLIDGAAPEKR